MTGTQILPVVHGLSDSRQGQLEHGTPGDCLMLATYDVRTATTEGELHGLLVARVRVKFHVIALEVINALRSGVCHLRDGTLVIREEEIPWHSVGDVASICRTTFSQNECVKSVQIMRSSRELAIFT